MTIASDRPAAIDLQTETLDLYMRSRSSHSGSQPSIFDRTNADYQSTNAGYPPPTRINPDPIPISNFNHEIVVDFLVDVVVDVVVVVGVAGWTTV